MTDQRTRGAAILPRTVELNHVAAARFAHARYTILPNPSKEFLNCLYRDNIELLCPEGAEIISFDKVVKIKDYDLIVISFGAGGSGTRWWDWKLVIEDGTKSDVATAMQPKARWANCRRWLDEARAICSSSK